MLIQYSVKNYKSIKDEVVINFSAVNKNVEPSRLVSGVNDNYPIYRCIGLAGPNASGKTNIVNSLFFALRFINTTIKRKDSAPINVEMFMLDEESRKDGASFEFIFLEDNIKYVYGFTIDRKRVLEEYLLAYYSKKATTVFERYYESTDEDILKEKSESEAAGDENTAKSIYNFRGNDVKQQTEISNKTNENRLYLPVAAEWGYEKTKPPYKWFERMFRQYNELNMSEMIAETIKDEESKSVLLEALRKADFNIKDVYVKNRRVQKQRRDIFIQLLTQIIGEGEEPEELFPEDIPVIWITHFGSDGQTFDIEIGDDSSGTRDIINNIAELLFINKGGGLFIEDELGKNYHTKLTEYFLGLFNDSRVNKANAQLFFSMHDTKIFKLLNLDQIYLVDKDERGATYVKLLDDYLIREKDNVELGYLKGRYGAIPDIKD